MPKVSGTPVVTQLNRECLGMKLASPLMGSDGEFDALGIKQNVPHGRIERGRPFNALAA
jgi:hypothetical protein